MDKSEIGSNEWKIKFLNSPPMEQLEFLYRYTIDLASASDIVKK